MMLLDRLPEHSAADRRRAVDLSPAELAERTRVRRVTMVPSGPTGLWAALAVASVRRLREDLPTVELAELGPRPSMFDGDPLLAVPLDDPLDSAIDSAIDSALDGAFDGAFDELAGNG